LYEGLAFIEEKALTVVCFNLQMLFYKCCEVEKNSLKIPIIISVNERQTIQFLIEKRQKDNDLQTLNIKIEQHETYLTGMNSGAAEWLEIPAPMETPLHLHPRCKYYRCYDI
jgi:hypothetical protein